MEKTLEGMKIAILVTDMFEEVELSHPRMALHEAGAKTEIIAPEGPEVGSANHFDRGPAYAVDRLLDQVDGADYDGVLLPGGALSSDQLRVEVAAQELVKYMDREDKPIAFICHAPWLLVSAGLVKGRTLTAYHTIADDIRNAGGKWADEEVVRDNNWISSRQPSDIPAFIDEMIALFSEHANSSGVTATKRVEEPAFREALWTEEDD